MTSKTVIFDYQNYMKDENLSRIKIKTPETRNNNIFIPIKHHHHKYLPLLFKTPKMYMPFKPHISNESGGYIRLSFDNIKIDKKLMIFHNFINSIEEYLENKLYEMEIIKKEKYHIKKTIKKADGFSDYFNLNFNNSDIKIYNNDLELINIDDVSGNFYAFFVIELSGFYCNRKSKHIRLVWNLLQFKLEKIKNIIDECLFLDESIIDGNNLDSFKFENKENKEKKEILKNNSILEKYFKMLSFGIPKMAVQHKMLMLKMDPLFLDYSPETEISMLPIDLKNKLELYESDLNKNTISNNQLSEKSDDINKNQENIKKNENGKPNLLGVLNGLNNIKLKSINNLIPNQKKKQILINKSLPVPTLKEIQDAYKKLKKGGDNNESNI